MKDEDNFFRGYFFTDHCLHLKQRNAWIHGWNAKLPMISLVHSTLLNERFKKKILTIIKLFDKSSQNFKVNLTPLFSLSGREFVYSIFRFTKVKTT